MTKYLSTHSLLLILALLLARFYLVSGHALSGGHPAMATSDDAGTFQRKDPMKQSSWRNRRPWGRWNKKKKRNDNIGKAASAAAAESSSAARAAVSPETNSKIGKGDEILDLPRGGAARLTLTKRQARNLVGISVAVVVAPSVAIPAVRVAAGVIAGVAVLDALDVIRL